MNREEIEEFFRLVAIEKNIEKVKVLLENGIDVNSISVRDADKMNVAQYLLKANKSYNVMEMMELLLDNGLDVNYKNYFGIPLLVSFLFTSFVFDIGQGEKHHPVNLDKINKTFNKIMAKKPALQYQKSGKIINILNISTKLNCLYLFEGQEHNMSKEDQITWNDYRLARLMEGI